MPKRHVHLVPQFHHDIEYLLPMAPYLEVSFENLQVAQRLLAAHPEYCFLVEQTFLIERFFDEYPSLLAAFRRYAQEGRFELSSGTYTMGDLNLPSGESFIRQALIGKRWCVNRLGLEPRVLNVGDCTGSPAQLPQLARLCGYDYIVFERAVDDNSRRSEILWRGLDGAQTRTYWLPGGYAGWYPTGPANERETLEAAVAEAFDHALSSHVVLAHGGDFRRPYAHGPACLRQWNRAHPGTHVGYSTYARALDAVRWGRAVPYTGEWNPDRQGCYSSRIRIKQWNRDCEALLLTAEAVSVLAAQQLGLAPDEEGLTRAWKLTLLNQFHDTLWGTVLDDAYRAALDRAGRVRMIARNLIDTRLDALLRTARRTAATRGRRLLVFNPLPWPRTAFVDAPAGAAATVRVTLPACGYRVVSLPPATRPRRAAGTPFTVRPVGGAAAGHGWTVRTPIYDAQFGPSGVLTRLVRHRDSLSIIDPRRPWFNALCLQSDRGDLWQYYEAPLVDGGPHGLEYDLIRDPYPLEPTLSRNGRRIIGFSLDNRVHPEARFEVRQQDAHRLVLRLRSELGSAWPKFREFEQRGYRIALDQTVVLYADSARIDFHLQTHHLKGRWYRLRTAFFTDIRDGEIIHEIPFGRFRRPEGEFAAQNFLVYADAHKGLALLNRGLPGNNVTDGVMMLSLMRSVDISTRGVPSEMAFEEGERHSFSYAILPFAGMSELDELALARQALEFVVPPWVHAEAPEAAQPVSRQRLPASQELLRIEPAAVCCTAIFPDAGRIAVRLYESEGRPVAGRVHLRFPVTAAQETDALLQPVASLPVAGGRIDLTFRAFEIKTVVLTPTT